MVNSVVFHHRKHHLSCFFHDILYTKTFSHHENSSLKKNLCTTINGIERASFYLIENKILMNMNQNVFRTVSIALDYARKKGKISDNNTCFISMNGFDKPVKVGVKPSFVKLPSFLGRDHLWVCVIVVLANLLGKLYELYKKKQPKLNHDPDRS